MCGLLRNGVRHAPFKCAPSSVFLCGLPRFLQTQADPFEADWDELERIDRQQNSAHRLVVNRTLVEDDEHDVAELLAVLEPHDAVLSVEWAWPLGAA